MISFRTICRRDEIVVAAALLVDEGKDMKPFNISANVIRDSSTKLILSLRASNKGVNDKD
jgi:hypothetical protein